MAYLKKVDDATNNPASGPGDGWFKISEVGYDNRESPPALSACKPLANKVLCPLSEVWGVDKLVGAEHARVGYGGLSNFFS